MYKLGLVVAVAVGGTGVSDGCADPDADDVEIPAAWRVPATIVDAMSMGERLGSGRNTGKVHAASNMESTKAADSVLRLIMITPISQEAPAF
jgi:hypothetical protein